MRESVGLRLIVGVVAFAAASGAAFAQQEVVSTARVTPPPGMVDPNPANNSVTVRQPVVKQGAGTACVAGGLAAGCAERAASPAASAVGAKAGAGEKPA